MNTVKINTSFGLFAIAVALLTTLSACNTTATKHDNAKQEKRWFNPTVFDLNNIENGTVYSAQFDAEFYSREGNTIVAKDCVELSTMSENSIAEREYVRWQYFKVDCEAVERFYRGSDVAINVWPNMIDFSFIQSLPATVIPDLGGDGMDDRNGSLGEFESNLTLIDSGPHNVKISIDEMVIDYVVVARGDFNRDGYHNLFIRMDWYIEGAFGDGVDWVVLSRKSGDEKPEVLWRK